MSACARFLGDPALAQQPSMISHDRFLRGGLSTSPAFSIRMKVIRKEMRHILPIEGAGDDPNGGDRWRARGRRARLHDLIPSKDWLNRSPNRRIDASSMRNRSCGG